MGMSQELQLRLLHCLREYRSEHAEEFSQGRRFAELEDEACELGDAVAAGLMAEVLAEQASQGPQAVWACCPRCQRVAAAEPEPEPRVLETRRGEVVWQEPKHYCDHCRQSFFPSVPAVRD